MKTEIKFKIEKQTPGAVRYMEVDEHGNKKDNAAGAAVGTLYVRKTAFGEKIPQSLTVTIEG